jgi:hypothetical protein
VPGVVKCDMLFMAGQFGSCAGSTRLVPFQHIRPPLSGSATLDPELGAAEFDRGRVLLGLTYLPLLTY